jgi:DNA-binding transcriptional LysR family regulator
MNIKLGQYKIFNEAASTLSFSLAAKNLFMTQSAVSQAINSLEKELDTTLFIRQAKSVTLTKEGLILHQHINNALEIITSAENQIQNFKELKDGELVIGASDTISQYFLTPYLVLFHKQYPNIKIKVLNRTSIEMIELMKSGQIDLGFLNMPIEDETLTIRECLKIHDIFVSANKDDKIYSNKEIAQMPLILIEKNTSSRQFLDRYFASSGILLQPRIELGAHELLLKLAQVNLGISCVIKEFSMECLNQGSVHEIKLEEPIPERSIAYAYLKRRTLSASATKFIELYKPLLYSK